MKITSKLLMATVVFFAACQKENTTTKAPVHSSDVNVSEAMLREDGNNPDENVLNAEGNSLATGHIYIQSNDAAGNAILMYNQQHDGKLAWTSTTGSGGNGSGAGLGSQSAVAINADNTLLFAVNAGSNSVSSFKIKNDGSLDLISTINSGGKLPVSVAVYKNLVYVVNSMSANISGYTIDADGNFTKIQGSKKALSDSTASPAQIAFSPEGNSLLVTEKMTNKISSFALDANGSIMKAAYTDATGSTPFGFDFSRDKYMIVSNASQGADNASTCTSYQDLFLHVKDVNGAVANQQSASCWVATTRFGRYAFVTNAKSKNIVSYYVDAFGALFYLSWSPAPTGTAPTDITVSANNKFVYNINSGDHTISEFQRSLFGTLQPIGTVTSIPMFASGLAAN